MVLVDTWERVVLPAKGVSIAALVCYRLWCKCWKTAEPNQVKVLWHLISSKLKSIKSMDKGSKSYAGEMKQAKVQLNFRDDKENVEDDHWEINNCCRAIKMWIVETHSWVSGAGLCSRVPRFKTWLTASLLSVLLTLSELQFPHLKSTRNDSFKEGSNVEMLVRGWRVGLPTMHLLLLKGSRLDHQRDDSQIPAVQVPEGLVDLFFYPLPALGSHMLQLYTCKLNMHNLKKINVHKASSEMSLEMPHKW